MTALDEDTVTMVPVTDPVVLARVRAAYERRHGTGSFPKPIEPDTKNS